MGRAIGLTIILLGVGLVASYELAGAASDSRSQSAEPSRDSILLEPDKELLRVQYSGSSSGEFRTYSLLGDGRLPVLLSSYASDTPRLLYTAQVPPEDVDAIVDVVLRSELYKLDRERVRSKHVTEPRLGPPIEDSGSVEFTIHLSLYPGTDPGGQDELDHTFLLTVSDMSTNRYPSIEEYAALREIVKKVRAAEMRLRAEAVIP